MLQLPIPVTVTTEKVIILNTLQHNIRSILFLLLLPQDYKTTLLQKNENLSLGLSRFIFVILSLVSVYNDSLRETALTQKYK